MSHLASCDLTVCDLPTMGCRQVVRPRVLTPVFRRFKSAQPSRFLYFAWKPPSPPTATAVIKGTSNVPGGFVRLLLEDVKKNRAACRLAVRRYDSEKPHSAESSTINTAETGETPLQRFSSVG